MHIYAGQVSGETVEDETFCAPKKLNSYQVLTVAGVLVVTEIALTTYRSKYKFMNSSKQTITATFPYRYEQSF
jgi:hypothetical protein